MIGLLAACAVLTAAPSGPEVTASQFISTVQGLHSDFNDISLVFEGDFKFVGPKDLIPVRSDVIDRHYQAVYLYREDGSTLIDSFEKGVLPESTLKHRINRIFKHENQLVAFDADVKPVDLRPRARHGGPGTLFVDGSPERILYTWLVKKLKPGGGEFYEFEAWEKIDGHNCLRVKLAKTPGQYGAKLRLWFDMERGGHPLKCEMLRGSDVLVRVDGIQLEQINLQGGKQVWLPVAGVGESFVWDTGVGTKPYFRETYSVVYGSVRINQGLKDSDFDLLARRRTAAYPESLKRLQQEFETTPPFRTDAVGVKERLDRMLAAADAQSEQLEATPRRPFFLLSPSQLAQTFFVLLGCGFIGFGVRRWRRG